MAFRKKYAVLALTFLSLSTFAKAADDIRQKIAQIEKSQYSHQSDIQKTRVLLDEKTAEIERIKIEAHRGIVSKILIQKKLKEAEAITNDLETLTNQLEQIQSNLASLRSELLDNIDVEIAALTKNKDSHQETQLRRLQELVKEKDRLLAQQKSKSSGYAYFNLHTESNPEKEDLIEKLQVIEDLEKNMRQKVAMIQSEIKEEQSSEFLRREIAHFIDEENFFGEQSFIANGLNRKESALNLNTTALTKNDAPGANTPSNQPLDGSATTTATATTTTATPVTSQSTSFQQPTDLTIFQNLLEQIQATIRETNPNAPETKNESMKGKATNLSKTKITNQELLQQNLALSQKILNDLTTLHNNLAKQIHQLD